MCQLEEDYSDFNNLLLAFLATVNLDENHN